MRRPDEQVDASGDALKGVLMSVQDWRHACRCIPVISEDACTDKNFSRIRQVQYSSGLACNSNQHILDRQLSKLLLQPHIERRLGQIAELEVSAKIGSDCFRHAQLLSNIFEFGADLVEFREQFFLATPKVIYVKIQVRRFHIPK